MIRKALIANRGEIACRIARTMRSMGICSVGVYSEADVDAMHPACMDEAWPIGPADALDSYLAIERLVDVALRSGAQAVHPGYGFLSESPLFVEFCTNSGLTFIGPSAQTMRMIGDKSAAKKLAIGIGVPTLPGYHGDAQDVTTFAQYARDVGYPILVKASAGGGGRGMRIVNDAEGLSFAMQSAAGELQAAFGDNRLLLEKYVRTPRHVEVQFFGDAVGNIVIFPERDCSLQRNHQKIIEETPAPNLDAALKSSLGEATVAIARACNYVGAGTAEFLVDRNEFYFLEVNARLQVEHPVTEMVTGVDLVEWQIRVACGERLPLLQDEISARGSAIEARICAEDPARGFLPSSGKIDHLKFPPVGEGIRIDAGIEQGGRVSPYYDSLLAKLIVWSGTRGSTILKLRRALAEVELIGVISNLDFLRELVNDGRFVAGQADTTMAGDAARRFSPGEAVEDNVLLAAFAASWRFDLVDDLSGERDAATPWGVKDGWGLFNQATTTLAVNCDGRGLSCQLRLIDDERFRDQSRRDMRPRARQTCWRSADALAQWRATGIWRLRYARRLYFRHPRTKLPGEMGQIVHPGNAARGRGHVACRAAAGQGHACLR